MTIYTNYYYQTGPLWRRSKQSRTAWRATHDTKSKTRHGGRGKIYGLKSKKKRRRALK